MARGVFVEVLYKDYSKAKSGIGMRDTYTLKGAKITSMGFSGFVLDSDDEALWKSAMEYTKFLLR